MLWFFFFFLRTAAIGCWARCRKGISFPKHALTIVIVLLLRAAPGNAPAGRSIRRGIPEQGCEEDRAAFCRAVQTWQRCRDSVSRVSAQFPFDFCVILFCFAYASRFRERIKRIKAKITGRCAVFGFDTQRNDRLYRCATRLTDDAGAHAGIKSVRVVNSSTRRTGGVGVVNRDACAAHSGRSLFTSGRHGSRQFSVKFSDRYPSLFFFTTTVPPIALEMPLLI